MCIKRTGPRASLEVQLLGDHLRVWRSDWTDGITWDELQATKNEAVGPDATCIEVYPPETEVVNSVNMRHLWVVPADSVPSLYQRLAVRDIVTRRDGE